ncbi:hypothetical protein PBAL39_01922 [Pedobacter sp. BAL39]|uniref:hypothetical protein n=1 Tax=Pedobacter sp. BAL39 TaxID=391596 RepID=UPI0001559A9E|nr:hypothetical protein [Pedobacter sp. BAL39]EDM38333.1 hypothetical protein PBAL39_01922 [Pedobacter sp. BAL39]
MKVLKLLDWPSKRYYGETHPLHRWRRSLLDQELKVEIYTHHMQPGLRDSDYLMIHSRYFENGWQNLARRNTENEIELISYLELMKKHCGRLIWFDAADSSGCADLALLPFVDVLLKKQLLKDMDQYTDIHPEASLRVWLDAEIGNTRHSFVRCSKHQLHKLKLGWNIGFNDYRYFGYKLSRLSNYLNYRWYPPRYTDIGSARPYDLTFRGTLHQDLKSAKHISYQRNYLIALFDQLKLNIARGKNVSKNRYWRELRSSKLSVSPFGWGEICYRDFETFISGALLVKPDMDHLKTFPDIYRAQETYIPVSWDMMNLEDTIDMLVTNYKELNAVARQGQEYYKMAVGDSGAFIHQLKAALQD